jgi:signal transduction histidine kinase
LIDFSLCPADYGAVLELKDSGSGSSDKDFDYIFDPFFSTSAWELGMGLAIVRE